MERLFAEIKDNKVVNIVVNVLPEVLAANPKKYIDYTNGWDYDNGIDGASYFIKPPVAVPKEE